MGVKSDLALKKVLNKFLKVSKAKKLISEKTSFIIVVSISIVIFILMIKPAKSTQNNNIHQDKAFYTDTTLKENLEVAESLRKNALLKDRSKPKKEPFVFLPPSKETVISHKETIQKKETVSRALLMRMNAPTTFLINDIHIDDTAIPSQNNKNNKSISSTQNNSAFLGSEVSTTEVEAKRIFHPRYTIPSGELIPATLETAINSDLPGMARAITSRNIYSLTGAKILIPQGSSLVGQFNSEIREGQNRVLIVWNRVQLANGLVVELHSPGTDTLGRSGQGASSVHHHFIQKFGSSILLSVLGFTAATSGVNPFTQYNSEAQYRTAIADAMQGASGTELQQNMNMQPTIHIYQGTKINIFVAHDLSFYNALRSLK